MSDLQMEQSYAVLLDALENMEEGMVIYDSSGCLLACNRAFRDMYGYTESQAVRGVHCDELGVLDVLLGNAIVGDEDGGFEDDFFKRKWAYREKLEGSLTVKMQDGRWIRTTDRPMKNNSLVSIHVDVTDLKHAQEKIQKTQKELSDLNISLEQQVIDRTQDLERARKIAEQQARTDALTGIKNRRAFFESANVIHQQTSRLKMSYTILIIDIDNFKLANDNHGHLIGDQVLTMLADAIQSVIGAIDVAGRIGGDEFSILLPESSADKGKILAEQLSACFIEKAGTLGDQALEPTLSIGVAEFCDGDNDTKSTLSRADKALYAAKQKGRNCVMLSARKGSDMLTESEKN